MLCVCIQTMLQVMRNWDLTMRGELDYRQEAANLREVRRAEINGHSCSAIQNLALVRGVSDVIYCILHIAYIVPQMREIMGESGLGAATPQPVPGLESQRVLVMTRLFGYKVLTTVTDLFSW